MSAAKAQRYTGTAHSILVRSVLAEFGCVRDTDGIPVMRLWQNNTGAAHTRSGGWVRYGIPQRGGGADLLGILRGTFLAVECKTGTGRLTPLQQDFRDTVLELRGIHLVVREDDWREPLQSLLYA